ncbi:MAG TPA: DUF1883 domain-containing protein [Candidatus Baltobacteraceae bacterium]|jgi:hypothetical protein|nr:DUF1883 domain-containing protein [Candidatus Baltobacteraceae bacterium]
MARQFYSQVFDLVGGQIVELNVDATCAVYLMTAENLARYRAGRDDFVAEGGMPLTRPIELVARKSGRWYLVAQDALRGGYNLRIGVQNTAGVLAMQPIPAP